MNFLLQTPDFVKSTNPFDLNDEKPQVQATMVCTFRLLFLSQINGSFPLSEYSSIL